MVVGVPGAEADVSVTVVTQEARIFVVLLHVIRSDVVIPTAALAGDDAFGQLGQRGVGVAAYPAAVGDQLVVPALCAFDCVIGEGIG
jgi:hypothetical protein